MLQDIVTGQKSLFVPGCSTEIRAQLNRKRLVSIVGGNLIGNVRGETSGVSARVWKGGVAGFSSEAELSVDAVRDVLRAASENALFMDRHAGRHLSPLPAAPGGFFPFSRDISDPEQKMYIEYLRELDSYISEKYPDLASRTLVATADSQEKIVATSDCADGSTITHRSYVYLIMAAETKDGVPVERFAPVGGLGTFDENFKSLDEAKSTADRIYRELMEKREGVYADAGVKTVILNGTMAGMVAHEAVGHTVEADLVLGGSVAGANLGKTVASEKVSMTDFAHTAFGKPCPLPVYLDDEGIVAADTPLIENGRLVGYMNNRESAAHFGQRANGNARAFSFSDEPLIRMRNTAVHPGTDKLADMIASVDDGYYFIDTNNGQADTTGEFMFGVCMGYEIKGGKLGRAILDTTISGVAFEMLKTVDMVSDEMTWASSGVCGKKQPMPVGMGGPALRCRITVGGR